MDSFRFHDIRVEKANAMAKYRRIGRFKALFRYVELFVFIVVLSRFSTQFSFSLKLSTEYFRGISVTLISPRSVFVVGNAIVILLFLLSGQFSGKKGEKSTDFYDEYVEKCRNNQQTAWSKEGKTVSDAYRRSISHEEKVLSRTHSENLERTVRGVEHHPDLRRSMSEKYRKTVECGRKAAAGGGSAIAEEEMSSEEFRRTVEAFIARQQRLLREEEDFSAVVSTGA